MLCNYVRFIVISGDNLAMETLPNRKEVEKLIATKALQGEETNQRNQLLKVLMLLKVGWTQEAAQPFQRMLAKGGFMQMVNLLVIGTHRQREGR